MGFEVRAGAGGEVGADLGHPRASGLVWYNLPSSLTILSSNCSDGVNLSLPEMERPKTDPIFAPWAHVDQSPFNSKFDTVQGIVNLLPNGPEDGGLMVFEGSSACYTELWQHFDHKKGEKGWSTWAYQSVDEDMCQWLEARGCKWTKVCAEPGDLLLWDSVRAPISNIS